jgi:CBS domain-containing protein
MNAAAPARSRYPFMNLFQQRMQRTCDFYLALRQELMNTRNQAMAENGPQLFTGSAGDQPRPRGRSISATDTVWSAADRMRKHGIAALVVKSGDAVKGSRFRTRHRASRLAAWRESACLGSVARRDAPMVMVAPTDSLKRAMSLMTNHRVGLLPVIADGKLVGIVS